jgi:hypothetical protein
MLTSKKLEIKKKKKKKRVDKNQVECHGIEQNNNLTIIELKHNCTYLLDYKKAFKLFVTHLFLFNKIIVFILASKTKFMSFRPSII